MKPFLLEIGCEELPARFIKPAKAGLEKLLKEGLETLRIGYSDMKLFGTPRRIVAVVGGMEEKQTETVTVKFGPPAARAFDGEGKPLAAATGFARSQGVEVSELKVRKKENAELLCVEKVETGRSTKEVLAEFLPDAVARIPFQKRMKWGKGTFEFGRPLHWIVALLGNDIIPFELADIRSGNTSRGHRFLSRGEVVIDDVAGYVDLMRENHIVVDEQERTAMMTEAIRAIEARTGATAMTDPDLMEEIEYITEYPYGLMGSFEKEYLDLPEAALVNVMKGHQRYIPIEKEKGTLLPGFIFFANTVPKMDAEVIRGNERVLRARLADAKFFFEEDKKVRLDAFYERLETVKFHKRLGNLRDKTERVRQIARFLASCLGLSLDDRIDRASKLIKADLLSHMVGEFPELQGIMGKIYAGHQGEEEDVARSIEEHYRPAGTDAPLPESALGAIMALADKLDSLIAFFSVGITPTGNLDPFALRRQAIGCIRIVIDKALSIPLRSIFETGYQALVTADNKVDFERLVQTLSEFIAARFKFLLMEEGHNQEFINAVEPYVASDIYDGYMRLRALETQESIEDFRRLMVGFKRVYNITKSMSGDQPIDENLFEHQEERDLYVLLENRKDEFTTCMDEHRYSDAISVLVGFKETIDRYFDKVFVMVEDTRLKENRLSLLARIKDIFLKYGDFSKIRVEELSSH
jgi:glycyl-tRNA synthetase beta chain